MVLETLATELTVREVDPAALAFVTNFSKLTGDYSRLSLVDMKVGLTLYEDLLSNLCVFQHIPCVCE